MTDSSLQYADEPPAYVDPLQEEMENLRYQLQKTRDELERVSSENDILYQCLSLQQPVNSVNINREQVSDRLSLPQMGIIRGCVNSSQSLPHTVLTKPSVSCVQINNNNNSYDKEGTDNYQNKKDVVSTSSVDIYSAMFGLVTGMIGGYYVGRKNPDKNSRTDKIM